MRHKKRKFDKAIEARRIARKLLPAPASTRVIPDKRKKPPKHKHDTIEDPDLNL